MKWYWWVAIGFAVALTFYFSQKENRDSFMKTVDETNKTITDAVQSGINYVLNSQQENFIKQLNPAVQNKFRQFIHEVQTKTGWTVFATSGYRSFADQQVQYLANNKNAKPGFSTHNYGLSLDLNLVKGASWLRKASPKQEWINSGAIDIAKQLGLKWGGESFAGYYDPVHFEVPGYDTSKLYAKATAQFGSDPNKIIGNQVNLA